MTASPAFALSLSIAAAALGLAHFAVWRVERRACWAALAWTCLLALVFFLVEAAYPVPTLVRPAPVATGLGYVTLTLGWLGVAAYLELPRRVLLRLALGMAAVAAASMLLVVADALSRIQVFTSYATLTMMVVATALVHLPAAQRRAHAVLLCAALLYPVFVGLAALGLLNMTYIRYAQSIPTLLVGLTMLVEGMLLAQRRTRQAADQAVAAQQRLAEVLQALAQGSSQVAATGQTMSEGAQLLAMRTDEQTSHIRETAEAVRGVVQQVQLTSGHVAAVDAECQRLDEQAHHGTAEVADTVAAIQRIEQRTQEMSEALVLIESVAFQTNLLALNAAIEAARAGEAGRGFAVVAGEVRALSHRTSASAGQVRTLIERARDQSAEGVHKVQGVRQTLGEMTQSVQGVAARMAEVAADAVQQRESLDGILHHLDALTQLTDANASMVANSVMASDQMNSSAQSLTRIVAEVGPGNAPGRAVPAPQPAAPQATAEVEFF